LTPKTQPANKSIASKAPITGRHHPGIPSDMISESVGDMVGIRRHCPGVGIGDRLELPGNDSALSGSR